MSTRLLILPALALLLFVALPAAADPALDYATETGHFYTQANGSPSGQRPEGFHISDDDGIPFWREYRWLGGSQALGYPISRRFQWDGFTCQATQRGILQWDARAGKVRLVNVLDVLSAAGRDGWLRDTWFIPRPLDHGAEQGLAPAQVGARRLRLLEARAGLRAAYLAPPDPVARYGLPTSDVTDVGPAYAIRLQRGVLYEWKEAVPWAAPGQVTVAEIGDIARLAGLLPAAALVPESPPAPSRSGASSRGGSRDDGLGPSEGVATWYGADFQGSRMSNGEPYDMHNPTIAASNIYPLGTLLRVTHRRTGAYIVVRVTDRGAFRYPIIVDLSWAAFSHFADPSSGVVPVRVEPVTR